MNYRKSRRLHVHGEHDEHEDDEHEHYDPDRDILVKHYDGMAEEEFWDDVTRSWPVDASITTTVVGGMTFSPMGATPGPGCGLYGASSPDFSLLDGTQFFPLDHYTSETMKVEPIC